MEFSQVLEQRRAVDYFDPDRPVDSKLIRQMVEKAALAPSSFNLQPWNLIIVNDPQKKAALQKAAWNQPKITQAPVIFIVLADRGGWKKGHPVMEKTFSQMVAAGLPKEKYDWFADACSSLYGASADRQMAFACKNAGFFAMALMLAAKDLGLDTHPMDGFELDKVRNLFSIPDNYWIPLLLAVGYFDKSKSLAPPKWRKTVDEIVVSF
ncbi:MAG: nitroreductase family protein [Desulfatibacillaceae bacterium]|nr:nitroreductase family protein [Desulfatibacillaceae bacterium]